MSKQQAIIDAAKSRFLGWPRQLVVGVPKASEFARADATSQEVRAIKRVVHMVAEHVRHHHADSSPSDWPSANTDINVGATPEKNRN